MSKDAQKKLAPLFEAMRKQAGGELPTNITFEQAKAMLDAFVKSEPGGPVAAGYKEGLELLRQVMPPDEDPNSPKAKKKRRIIEAAAKLFAKNGVRKTSIDEIARRAQVAKGTVYLYFEGKSALLMQAIVHEKTRYAAKLQPLFSGELSPEDMLRAWLRVFFQGMEEMPIISRLMSGDREIIVALEDLGDSVGMNVVGVQADVVAQMIDNAAAPHRYTKEEIHDRATVLLALLYTASQIFDERLRDGIPRDRFAGLLADILVDGLVGLRPEKHTK